MSGQIAFEYQPGPYLAVCGGRFGALLDIAMDDPVVDRLVETLPWATSAEEVVELLISPGLRAITTFGVVQPIAEGTRVLVRGGCSAEVAGGESVVSSGLWADHVVASSSVRLTMGAAENVPALKLGWGVAFASSLRTVTGGPSYPTAASVPQLSLMTGNPELVTTNRAALLAAEQAGNPTLAPPNTVDTLVEQASVTLRTETFVTRPALEQDVDRDPHSERTGPSYDDLFANTVNPSMLRPPPPAEQRVSRDKPSAAPQAMPLTPSVQQNDQSDSGRAGVHAPRPAPDSFGSTPQGFIGEVPPWMVSSTPSADIGRPQRWGLPPTSPSASPATVQAPPARVPTAPMVAPGESTERTVSRDALRSAVAGSGPFVQATQCRQGHLNPAHAVVCRVCRDAIPAQDSVRVPRPPLGSLRFSNGETVVLDRTVVLGRNPVLPTGYIGEQPNLLRLNDPGKDVSSQHAEVKLDHWHVVVSDLGSTNGTVVVLPGREPVQLRPGDPLMIEPGTQVVLAGVVSFTFEVS